MKPFYLLFFALFFCIYVSAQKRDLAIYLKTGKLSVQSNITAATVEKINLNASRFNQTAFALIQFQSLPTEETRKQLAAQGITLLEYIPHNTYTVSIKGTLSLAALKTAKARAILEPSPQQKMFSTLAEESLQPGVGTYKDVWVSFPKTFSATDVISQLKALKYEVVATELMPYNILSLKVPTARLAHLASLPYIEYIQPAPPKDEPLNARHRSISGANVLNATTVGRGRGLNGEGVVIGIGDNGNMINHVDLLGPIIDHTAGSDTRLHSVHVTGTVAGSGILNELNRGYAPKATIISQTFSGIITAAQTYVQQFGMVATNNSYGNTTGCSYTGTYDLNARIVDRQAFDFPNLQHVFASGNSGGLTCSPFPLGFGTVLGGFQSAKNVITVGNMDADENIFSSSSRGPVRDGRLKPEISALGTAVVSTSLNNSYGTLTGTSQAAPGVTGGIALLYQRYRQLHANANPKSGLVKALLCNGASDKGNAGPDFRYGFGSMNLLRSVDMMEQDRFINDSLANMAEKQFTISVPANTAQLKVMLYWHDPAASPFSDKTLVNDLDLQLATPSAQPLFPKILDSSAEGVNSVATTGPDHTNNIEQVSVDDPEPGNYTIRVIGTEIAQNPRQEFFVVYDIVPNSLVVTSPAGGEGLAPGENARITWQSFGDQNTTFSLEYATDSGAVWTPIATGIKSGTRFFTWKVPAVVSDKAVVRVTKEATGQSIISNVFNIIGVPVVSLSPAQCEGYFNINWRSIDQATDYEVTMLKGNEMVPVAFTTDTFYSISSLSKDSTYWLSVRARINGKEGRRALAVSRQPNSGNCAGTMSDNDLVLQSIISPVSGRKFTSSGLSVATPVKVEVKNLDNAPVQGFSLKYSVDGGNTWTEEDLTVSIDPGQVYTHTFAKAADLSAIGTYQLLAVVKAVNIDASTGNDTLSKTISHFDNKPLDLSAPFVDDLESASPETYTSGTMGLKGLERYDLLTSTPYGRLRTFFNSGFAASGTKALNLDASRYVPSSNINFLVGTFNLSNYDLGRDKLRLSFRAFGHGQDIYENNKVWVRQDDTSSWIEVFDFNKNPSLFNYNFGLANNIEFSDSLLKHGQNVSSSFQIRWGQQGQAATIDESGNDGYSFDDISIYKVIDDIQLVKIDIPTTVYCGFNDPIPFKVILRNTGNNPVENIPVRYAINDGDWVSEHIPLLEGNTTLTYTFKSDLVFSSAGSFNIKVVADMPTDNYRTNDTASTTLHLLPYITTFPYLENFEQGNGGWFADGTNNSWAYGKPSSPKIDRAASGSHAWKTALNGTYNNNELSYLYSPCFNIDGMRKPTLSFSLAIDLENCGSSICEAAWVEYSVNGRTWIRLADTTSFNWYDKSFFWTIEDDTHWHVATTPLPLNQTDIRFRFGFFSDSEEAREGIALDDIHIYDDTLGIAPGPTVVAPITQTINGGNKWIHFESDGKLVASILPNNQNLGNTEIGFFVNKDPVRQFNNLFYHDRSFVINPANNNLTDSVTIRLYILNSEMEALINATGCNCSKPASVYDLGVSKYHDNDKKNENNTIDDNSQGLWSFYAKDKVTKVPFDKGYYLEFKVKDFSEFWLSDKSLGNNIVLPVTIKNLNVIKEGRSNALVSWTVENESDVDRYEIEVARGTLNSQQGNFEKIGEVTSRGNATLQDYSFTDKESSKSGTRYYRLKTVDINGSFTYSGIKSLTFSDTKDWIVYPNPSFNGNFFFVYQMENAEEATVQLTDAIGRLVKTYHLYGNGNQATLTIDISTNTYPKGIYMLKIASKEKEQVFKLYKQ